MIDFSVVVLPAPLPDQNLEAGPVEHMGFAVPGLEPFDRQ